MVTKIGHYSLENHPSIYDEEAMTALELAGRTAQKVNECVDKVNEIPQTVADDVQAHIDSGKFDKQIDKYAGNVVVAVENTIQDFKTSTNGRIDNLLKNVVPGTTTFDAEVIDARLGYNGTVYTTLGTAIRESVKEITGRVRNVCLGVVGTALDKILLDTESRTITVKADWYAGHWGMYQLPQDKVLSYEPQTGVKMLCLNVQTKDIYLNANTGVTANPSDIVLCYLYFVDTRIIGVWGSRAIMERITQNGKRVVNTTAFCPANPIGASDDARIEIDTGRKRITFPQGFIFFDNKKFVAGNAGYYLDYSDIAIPSEGATRRLVINGEGKLELTYIDAVQNDHYNLLQLWFEDSNGTLPKGHIIGAPSILKCVYRNGTPLEQSVTWNRKTAKIFRKVVCCGDSFTSGHIVDSSGTAHITNEDYAWPHYMATETGNTWENCGVSGANVLTWQENEGGLEKARNLGKAQAYTVGLQLNDVASGTNRHVPLGTVADIPDATAGTYYGGLSAIVQKLHAISPKAHIFLFTTPLSGGLYDEYNKAVRDVMSYYRFELNKFPELETRVHLLDLMEYKNRYDFKTLANDRVSGHYTAQGYEQFAEILMDVMSDYINAHYSDFQDVAFIEYD